MFRSNTGPVEVFFIANSQITEQEVPSQSEWSDPNMNKHRSHRNKSQNLDSIGSTLCRSYLHIPFNNNKLPFQQHSASTASSRIEKTTL